MSVRVTLIPAAAEEAEGEVEGEAPRAGEGDRPRLGEPEGDPLVGERRDEPAIPAPAPVRAAPEPAIRNSEHESLLEATPAAFFALGAFDSALAAAFLAPGAFFLE